MDSTLELDGGGAQKFRKYLSAKKSSVSSMSSLHSSLSSCAMLAQLRRAGEEDAAASSLLEVWNGEEQKSHKHY